MKLILCSLVALQVLSVATSKKQIPEIPPDVAHEANLNLFETIANRGYKVEEHDVTTDDGYILRLARIPRPGSKVVFLQHGLLDAANTWVINFPQQSLGYILYDAGYDVWLGNVRGNTYGRAHVKLSPSTNAFWNFTFHEMAMHDLPAMLNYVLAKTGREDLYYVGHSQGCMIGLAGFPVHKELAAKVRLFVQLAPAANLGNIGGVVNYLAPWATAVDHYTQKKSAGEFMPSSETLHSTATGIANEFIIKKLRQAMKSFSSNYDPQHINETRIPVYWGYTPAGTSSRNVVHYSQNFLNKRFAQFDFGVQGNIEVYGQNSPPEYEVTNMNIPTVVLYSAADNLATKKDVEGYLLPRLPKVLGSKDYGTFQHNDFVWGKSVYQTLYQDVLNYLANN